MDGHPPRGSRSTPATSAVHNGAAASSVRRRGKIATHRRSRGQRSRRMRLVGRGPDSSTAHQLTTGGTDMTPERQFFGPGYHPGHYVFTFVTDALRIRTRSDSGSTASPRRPWSRAFPSMGHYATHTQRRPEGWRESENHQRADRAKHRHYPVAHLANTAAEQPETPQPRRGGPITGKAAGHAHRTHRSTCAEGTNPSFIHR
jgi:hypothetical protein